MLTVFIGLILGTRRLRTEELPPAWATATRALQIVEPSGHPGCLFAGDSRKQEMRHCKGIKNLLAICPCNHRNDHLLPNQSLLESETESCELSVDFVSAVVVSSTRGFLSLAPCWVFFVFSFHCECFHQVGLLLCSASGSQEPS